MRARLVAIAAAAAAAIGVAAAPSEAATSICLNGTRAAIAKDLGIKARAISMEPMATSSDGMPQCVFKSSRVSVTVNVDNGPQAAWRLARTDEEATQLFGPPPPGWHAPIGEPGLGPYAAWYLNRSALLANNHTRTELLTVTVAWPHAKLKAEIKLARAAIEPYYRARALARPIPATNY